MLNISCNIRTPSHQYFYVLNKQCSSSLEDVDIPFTTIVFGVLAGISLLLAFITYLRFNNVSVLNYYIYINAISNNWWILYFITVGARSIVLSVQYSHGKQEEGYFLTNWILGAFELLILCFALNYQRKFRSTEYINQEIDMVGNYNLRTSCIADCKALFRVFASSGTLLSIIFVVILASILMFIFMDSHHADWFWVYVSFLLLLNFSALLICISIAIKFGDDEPRCKTKTFCCILGKLSPQLVVMIYFIISILLTVLEHIPIFIWKYCAGSSGLTCWGSAMTMFDLFVMLKMVSLLTIFRALQLEYNRLKQECQYAMLNEVQGYSFE